MSQGLHERHCTADTARALAPDALGPLLAEVGPHWQVAADGKAIHRELRFGNFHETMAFVNAVAWVAHTEDHHPELAVGYNRCQITYSTHSAGGLTENDFICAARVEALLR